MSGYDCFDRSADAEDVFPDELMVPLGRADHMLDDAAIVSAVDVSDDAKSQEESSNPQQESPDKSPAMVRVFHFTGMDNTHCLLRQDTLENGSAVQTPSPTAPSGGLLGFLNAYPNPFTRWSTSAKSDSQVRPPSLTSSRRSSGVIPKLPGGLGEDETRKPDATLTATVATAMPASPSSKMYPLSIVLVVALIAFLIGSLLRSLLSPADFIYVVTDIKDAEEVSTGWREIRRLIEVKYIVGGWDFQIAVVRRH